MAALQTIQTIRAQFTGDRAKAFYTLFGIDITQASLPATDAKKLFDLVGDPDFAPAWVARGSKLLIGAQDCHPDSSGAFTGDIAAEMLKDAGAVAVIVGHSERRTLHHETHGRHGAGKVIVRPA